MLCATVAIFREEARCTLMTTYIHNTSGVMGNVDLPPHCTIRIVACFLFLSSWFYFQRVRNASTSSPVLCVQYVCVMPPPHLACAVCPIPRLCCVKVQVSSRTPTAPKGPTTVYVIFYPFDVNASRSSTLCLCLLLVFVVRFGVAVELENLSHLIRLCE